MKILLATILIFLPLITKASLLSDQNKIRQEAGLEPLVWDEQLAISAERHAKYIYLMDDWNHTTKVGSKFSIWITNLYDYVLVGENIGRKFKTEEKMLKAWLKSDQHKKNIMDDFDETGIGTYKNVTVQLFGKLK